MTLLGRVSRENKTDISLLLRIKPFLPLLLYVVAALSIAAIYAVSFQRAEKLIEHDKLRDLGAIADAKVAQIVAWRESQIRSGEHLSRDTQLNVEFERWLQEGAPENGRKQQLRQILDEMQYLNGYQDVQLLDSHSKVRLSVNRTIELGDEEMSQARQAMDRKEIMFLDIHRDNYGNHELSLDLVAPLIVAGKPDRVVGAVVLHIPPDRMLYPLLQLWPSQSSTAETLLVRRDGDDVLFLNELRHRKGTALALRMPLDMPDLPAAMAVRGVRSTAESVDYRGAWVVAEMRPIPGTPWFMVSKIDRDELFAPLNRLKQWSTGLAFGFLAVSGVLLFLWLRNYRSRYQLLKSQRDAAVERELLAMHYEYLTRYANDIIMVADVAGNLIEANERAQQAYGYSREEMQGMQVGALCDSDTFQRKLAQFDELGESRFETVNRRRDGSTFPVEVSARAIEIVGVKYLQFIIRDISERRQAEEALRRSETLLNKSQRLANIGSWELDLKENILYWSDENYRIFEQPHDGGVASYETFLSIVHPDDREMVNRVYTDSVKNRTPYSIVHRLLFPDRRVKFVQEWCETFYDTDGQPLRSTGTTQDVTVQQMAQNALRKSMQRIEDLYNHAPCGYHSLDKGGFIVQINDTELQWLGYTRDEVIGKIHITDLLAPASRHVFRDKYPEFIQRGFIRELEYELVRKNGTSFSVLLSATAVYDVDGEYLMSRSTLFDITERKRVESQLVESEARFHSMADNAPIMIWMADMQGQQQDCQGCQGCNYFNQKWYDFTGLPHESAQSCAWQALIHPDDKTRCLDTYRDAFQSAQTFSLEYRLRRHDGVFRWIRDSGVPRSNFQGEFIGFIGICTDVTDLKMFDEIRAELEHVGRLQIAGEMASGLAHELSQPLSAANNYLSAGLHHMAEDNWDKDKLLKAVTLAHAQTARAGDIVNHLKELVRKQRQERVMLDINELIRDTLHFMEFDIRHKSISVVMDFYSLPPTQVSRIEIEQVLINLFRNAIDSMDSTSRRVLRVTTRVIESGFILVSVSDTGTGIAPDALDKVFNPFHTSKNGGLGLGLPICRSLIENHGGQIWAEHNGDEGAEFNFTLPVGVCYA